MEFVEQTTGNRYHPGRQRILSIKIPALGIAVYRHHDLNGDTADLYWNDRFIRSLRLKNATADAFRKCVRALPELEEQLEKDTARPTTPD